MFSNKSKFVCIILLIFSLLANSFLVLGDNNSEASGSSSNIVGGSKKLRTVLQDFSTLAITGARVKIWDKEQQLIYEFNALAEQVNEKVDLKCYNIDRNEDYETFTVKELMTVPDIEINYNEIDTFKVQGLPTFIADKGELVKRKIDGSKITEEELEEKGIKLFLVDDITNGTDEERRKYIEYFFTEILDSGSKGTDIASKIPDVSSFNDFFGENTTISAYRKSWLGGRLEDSDPIPPKVAMITYEPLFRFLPEMKLKLLTRAEDGLEISYLLYPGDKVEVLTQKELEKYSNENWDKSLGFDDLLTGKIHTGYFKYSFGKNPKLDAQIIVDSVMSKIFFGTGVPFCGAYCHYATDVATPSQIFVKFHPNGDQLSTEAGDSDKNKINEEFTINTNSGEKVSIPRTFPDNFSKYV